MPIYLKSAIVLLLLICSYTGIAQQLVLGNNPYQLNKSAVLELNSNNQGLLLPRITDTSLINALNPPDGMVVYHVPSKQMIVKMNGSWRGLATAQSYMSSLTGDITATGPGAATATITNNAVTYQKMQNVSATNRLLGRASAGSGVVEEITLGTGLSYSGTTINVSSLPNSALANSSITVNTGSSGSDFNISGSPVSLGGSVTLNLPTASATNRGLLSSADWTSFNNKVSASRSINTTAPLSGGGDLSSDRTLSMTQAGTSSNGWLSSTDWNTFNSKVSNTISSSRLWGRTSAGTGVIEEISIGSGLSLTAGVLAVNSNSTSWTIAGNSGTTAATNFIGTTDNRTLVVKTNNTERIRVDSMGRVGINTPSPNATLDLEGSMAYRTTSITLAGGANNHNVDIGNGTFVRISGPTSNFEITGFAGGFDGRLIILYNSTAHSLKLKHLNNNSSAENRIINANNDADTNVSKNATLSLIYSGIDAKWVVITSK